MRKYVNEEGEVVTDLQVHVAIVDGERVKQNSQTNVALLLSSIEVFLLGNEGQYNFWLKSDNAGNFHP